ncbi:MAG: hypothetical protein WBK95_10550 [Sulfurimonas sp.]|nr:hypothetical protein [Sulfurimonas sp.]MDD5202852.1 hypothetical protein [Sulfurimonas sp.]
MIQIKYPHSSSDFVNEYLAIFDLVQLEQDWNTYKTTYNLQNCNFTVQDILKGDFNFLLDKSLKIAYPISDIKNKIKLYKLKKIFDYDKYQPQIANFFMKYKSEMKLSTCYYCNIDYINAFVSDNYPNKLDFINNANQEIFTKISNVGEATFKKIDAIRPYISVDDFQQKLNSKKIQNLDEIIETINNQSYPQYIQKNHFTLDHVIDKATNPIVALSLFNFVPSCYSCNSKFKKSEQFTNNSLEHYKSPTHSGFHFDEKVKFKLLFSSAVTDLTVKSIDDIDVLLKDNENLFDDYIKIFKLNDRYRYHKNIILELLNKKQDYSNSRIDEISKIVGKSKKEIEKDLFGKEIFEGELQEEPFTKLKRDIYV